MDNCEICDRDKDTTFHHLIPKCLHRNGWFKKRFTRDYMRSHGIQVCDDCNKAIHSFWDEKTLGKHYNTKVKLLETKQIKKHIVYVRKLKK
jgi:hypothetical protein